MAEFPKTEKLTYFIPGDWLNDANVKSVCISVYSSSLFEEYQFNYCKKLLPSLDNPVFGKYKIIYAHFDNDIDEDDNKLDVSFREGGWSLNFDGSRKIKIRQGNYVILYTPLPQPAEDGGISWENTNNRQSWMRGILTSVFGMTACYRLCYQYVIETTNPDFTQRQSDTIYTFPVSKIFQLFDAGISELDPESIPADVRERSHLCFKLLSKLSDELDPALRFSFTWMALEAVTGGHAGAKNYLNSVAVGAAQEAKFFIDARNALFHHGRFPVFNDEDERFLISCITNYILKSAGVNDKNFDDFVNYRISRRANK